MAAVVQNASPTWWRAMNLDERRDNGRASRYDQPSGFLRASRWLTLPALKAKTLSRVQALSPFGLSWDDLEHALGETEESLANRWLTQPKWMEDHSSWLGDAEGDAPEMGMLNVVRPLISGARRELRQRLGSVIDLEQPWGESFAVALCNKVPLQELSQVVGLTMVLELNVYRELGKLVGGTPEERFRYFTSLCTEPELQSAIREEYPVLVRQVAERLRFWIERRLDLAQSFTDDAEDISVSFWAGMTPTTVDIDFGAGDTHREGRSVAIFTTDVGKVVYKPRRPNMERAFAGTIDWFNASSPPYKLRVPEMVDRGEYAWFEFIKSEQIPLGGADQCSWRLGALNAVLFALQSTDFHHENIVYAGVMPVPVDLESLLHTERRYANEDHSDLVNVASDALAESCVGVGILPSPIVTSREGRVYSSDISAVGYRSGQSATIAMPRFLNESSDEMHVVNGPAPLTSADDASMDREVLWGRRGEFRAGFAWAYRAIISDRSAWVDAGGLIDGYANARSRYIPRPTMVYGKLLSESYHPDFMRDGVDRDLCLGKLLAGYANRPEREALIRAEIADLRQGDIPFFEVDALTGEFIAAMDTIRVLGGTEPPIERIRSRIREGMGAQDLKLQLQLIDYSYATLPHSEAPLRVPLPALTDPIGDSRDQRLTTSLDLIRELRENMVIRPNGVGWMSMAAIGETVWVTKPTTMDVYGGLSGIALALEGVAIATEEEWVETLRLEVLDQIKAYGPLIDTDAESIEKIRQSQNSGAFGHIGGFALIMGREWIRNGDEGARQASARALDVLRALAPSDGHHDFVTGNAGVLSLIDALAGVLDRPAHLTALADISRALESAAIRDTRGARWQGEGNDRPLIGFSHGTTGIAWSLVRAAEALERPELAELAGDALRFERVNSELAAGDWPDLRSLPIGTDHMRAWCHGSPGAGFGRALIQKRGIQLDPVVHQERKRAIATTALTLSVENGRGAGNNSLCHGNVGNLICLETMLGVDLGRTEVTNRTDKAWERIIGSIRSTGGLSGAATGVVIPDLMMGYAGIAWGLAYSTRQAPSFNILALDTE